MANFLLVSHGEYAKVTKASVEMIAGEPKKRQSNRIQTNHEPR